MIIESRAQPHAAELKVGFTYDGAQAVSHALVKNNKAAKILTVVSAGISDSDCQLDAER